VCLKNTAFLLVQYIYKIYRMASFKWSRHFFPILKMCKSCFFWCRKISHSVFILTLERGYTLRRLRTFVRKTFLFFSSCFQRQKIPLVGGDLRRWCCCEYKPFKLWSLSKATTTRLAWWPCWKWNVLFCQKVLIYLKTLFLNVLAKKSHSFPDIWSRMEFFKEVVCAPMWKFPRNYPSKSTQYWILLLLSKFEFI